MKAPRFWASLINLGILITLISSCNTRVTTASSTTPPFQSTTSVASPSNSATSSTSLRPSSSSFTLPASSPAVSNSQGSGVITYSFAMSGTPQIWVINSDGTNPIQITDSGANYAPNLSKDGTKIVFSGGNEQWAQIFSISPNDTNLIKLTSLPDGGYEPSWSPDGKKIAFHGNFQTGQQGIYVMNSDGSSITRLTDKVDTRASLSPDGKKIAFISNNGIFTIDSDGTNRTLLIQSGSYDVSWSPDGKWLAFDETISYEPQGIFLIHPDGTGQTRIPMDEPHPTYPSWSPDGSKIIFLSGRDPPYGIFTVNLDGTNLNQISNVLSIPSWGLGRVSNGPRVITKEISNLTDKSAVLSCNVTGLKSGISASLAIVWGIGYPYDRESDELTIQTDGNYQIKITGMSAGSSYHYSARLSQNGVRYSEAQPIVSGLVSTIGGSPVAGNGIVNCSLQAIIAFQPTLITTLISPTTPPINFPTSLWFEWGTTAAYGNTTQPVNGSPWVITMVTGLLPDTTYHFRAVGQVFGTNFGIMYGEDMTFTTPG
jgi:TolB protein